MKSSNIDHMYCLTSLYKEYSGIINNYLQDHPDYLTLKYLLDDMIHDDPNKGQIQKALLDYERWGKYYLISLEQSHFKEITINFKDESIKNYSGHFAFAMAAELNDIFASIPLVMNYGPCSNYRYQPQTPPVLGASPVSGLSYVDRNSSCFIGNCKIQVSRNDNTMLIKLEDLVSGDILYRRDSNLIVKHILKSQISVEQPLYKYNNLIGTEKHPIKINDVWFYMKDIGEKYINDKSLDTEYVYTISVFDTKENKYVDNFILENFQCATIGHGYLDNPEDTQNILRSTFWGKTIIEIFEKISSNNNILTLMLGKYHFLRDETTGWTNYLILEE